MTTSSTATASSPVAACTSSPGRRARRSPRSRGTRWTDAASATPAPAATGRRQRPVRADEAGGDRREHQHRLEALAEDEQGAVEDDGAVARAGCGAVGSATPSGEVIAFQASAAIAAAATSDQAERRSSACGAGELLGCRAARASVRRPYNAAIGCRAHELVRHPPAAPRSRRAGRLSARPVASGLRAARGPSCLVPASATAAFRLQATPSTCRRSATRSGPTAAHSVHALARVDGHARVLQTGQGVASEKPSGSRRRRSGTNRVTPPVGTPARLAAPRHPARTHLHPARHCQGAHGPRTQSTYRGRPCARCRRRVLDANRRSRRHGRPLPPHRREVSVQMLRSGPETEPTYSNTEINGIPVGTPMRSTGRRTATSPGVESRFSSRSELGEPGSTSRGSKPTTAASDSRPSSSIRRRPHSGSRSSCRPRRGRPTTSTTRTATVG